MIKPTSFKGVDFHCHLDLYPDLMNTYNAVEKAGIYTLSVTTTPKAWPRNRDLTNGKVFIRAALGFHPQLVADRAHELHEWEQYLPEAKYIGEVGLDAGPRFRKSLDIQKRVFKIILERCADIGGKILTVHSTRCAEIVLDMIEEHLSPERGRVVLHWFTGSIAQARRASELGCYFSINKEMAQKERGRELITTIPRERLLTETDGPFTQTNGRPTHPTDIHLAVKATADILGITTSEMGNILLANLKSLLT